MMKISFKKLIKILILTKTNFISEDRFGKKNSIETLE